MNIKPHLSFLTLLLMISFASVNAVLFTPALPAIAQFFAITDHTAQLTITWFLIGYAVGQLLYGPFANRFGRKPTLYAGIVIQILSSLLCALAGVMHDYSLLVLGRLFLALGSGVGLKMTFTLVNESYEPNIASQKLSYLMIAFAITPGLGVMIGSYLSVHLGWMSTFLVGALYGVILLVFATQLPETKKSLDLDALKMEHLISSYVGQFKNLHLVAGGLLMSGATCFIYVFAAFAPFIAMNLMHMDVANYGVANLLPPIGMIIGSLVSVQLVKKYKSTFIIALGILVTLIGSIAMLFFITMSSSALFALFIPMMICYLGLSLIFANASTLAMSHAPDKSHGSAVMNFINMGLATFVVLSIGMFAINYYILPILYIVICIFMAVLNLYFYSRSS